MDAIAIIALVNALVDIGFRVVKEYQAPAGTPAEQIAKLEALKASLAEIAAKVDAYRPLERDQSAQ